MEQLKHLVFILLLLLGQLSFGQTTYHMSNATTYDCKGKLTDSQGGATIATYGNNENFTFKIITGAKITLKFNSPFCLDAGFDWLRIYDGPDTNSTLIGAYTGNTPPPTAIAYSGYMTFHFKSDANATYCGWDADWTTEKIAPIPPTMMVSPIPSCNAFSVKVNFSKKISCDSVNPGDFVITGPVPNILVTSITAGSACGSPGDSSNAFILHLNKGLNQNCDYTIFADIGLPDNCDSIWHFILIDSFLISNCPFTVNIDASPDTICPGMCSDLTALISGNGPNCLSYIFTWNNGLPNSAGPHTVCPSGSSNLTINYTVSVRSTLGGPIVNTSKILYYLNPEINEPDTITVCQSDTLFFLNAFNPGGRFSGQGIVNAISGLFNPNTAGAGNHLIKYGYPGYCQDSILIIVKGIDAGLPEAACPGASPFLLKGFSPPGGIWSGDSITPSGVFNPAVSGTYTVTYSVNGCTESKKITVDSIVLNTAFDTLCKSLSAFQISITPPGGRWTGPGITDSILGIFNPAVANLGQNNLTYKLSGTGNSGCSFNISTYVLQIEASSNFIVCPQQPPITLTGGLPANGWWTGRGVTDSISGAYNPFLAFNGNQGNDSVFYHHSNGCKDWRIVYVRNTYIIYDTLEFCENDPRILLSWANVRNTPGGGVWTGNGITKFGSSTYYFYPNNAGVGAHKLRYMANSCGDSIVMVVFPTNIKKLPYSYLYPDTVVCNTHPNWNLPSMPPGGKWTGRGIINSKIGTFSPAAAGSGVHKIKYQTNKGCVDDSIMITVYPFVSAKILGLDSVYCYKDTLLPITLIPSKGVLTGAGVDLNNNFNPVAAGEGMHTLTYTFGNGLCQTTASIRIRVSSPISTTLTASDTVLCQGDVTHLEVIADGGSPSVNLTYLWNNNLFPVNQHDVSPTISTLYTVTISDGCSDDKTDSIFIRVDDPIKVTIETSDTLCFGLDGFANVVITDSSSNYQVTWKTDPEQVGSYIEGQAGDRYRVIITKLSTSCDLDTMVKIPNYKNVTAMFTTSPSYDCIPTNQKVVTFLDLSFNADSGSWDIAGIETIPYQLGVNPQHTFTDAGYYTITLKVFNKGGCSDEFSQEICIEDIRPVFVADAFTPNGDGVNDVLHVKAKGVKELRFQIFDRWGNMVFESTNIDNGWDGTIAGNKANPGVYIYLVQTKLINNERVIEKGNVTLIR